MRLHSTPKYVTAVAAAFFAMVGVQASRAAPTSDPPSFKQDVLPILQEHCSKCHSPGEIGYQAIGLDLTNYHGLMSGSRHGPAVIPHQPQLGTLMKTLDWKKDYYVHMPALGHQLPEKDIDTIRAWIAAGAKDN